MIAPEIARKYGVTFHNVLHMPVNVCSHCGYEDDPECARSWEWDDDDDKICPSCVGQLTNPREGV